MATSTAFVHELLKVFCREDAGIGISKTLFAHLIGEHIKRSSVYLKGLPSYIQFKDFTLSFDVDATAKNIDLELSTSNGSSVEVSLGRAGQVAFTAILTAYLDSDKVCTFAIDFSNLVARLLIIYKKFRLVLKSHNASEVNLEKAWEKDSILRGRFEKMEFTESTWKSLTSHLKAASIIATHEIAKTVFSMITFPDFLSVFRGIRFGDNSRLTVEKRWNNKLEEDLVMFTSSSSLNIDSCPRDPVDGSIRLKPSVNLSQANEVHEIGKHDLSESTRVLGIEVRIAESPARSFPRRREVHTFNSEGVFKWPLIDKGHVFLYTPALLLEKKFDGIARPAIGNSDHGSWGPFYYRWSASAQLKEFSVRSQNGWPITFRINTPLDVHGQGGAGIEVGSVRHEVFGAQFHGVVEPFEIEFRAMLDWPRREILFESRIEKIHARCFRFKSSVLGFPLNKIFDVVLGEVAEAIINDQAGKILKSTRIPIANLQLLEEVGELDKALTGSTDSDGATMGVKYKALP